VNASAIFGAVHVHDMLVGKARRSLNQLPIFVHKITPICHELIERRLPFLNIIYQPLCIYVKIKLFLYAARLLNYIPFSSPESVISL
jgi:hypothetical protein